MHHHSLFVVKQPVSFLHWKVTQHLKKRKLEHVHRPDKGKQWHNDAVLIIFFFGWVCPTSLQSSPVSPSESVIRIIYHRSSVFTDWLPPIHTEPRLNCQNEAVWVLVAGHRTIYHCWWEDLFSKEELQSFMETYFDYSAQSILCWTKVGIRDDTSAASSIMTPRYLTPKSDSVIYPQPLCC